MNLDDDAKSIVKLLKNVKVSIMDAYYQGDAKAFDNLGKEYGPHAFRLYLALSGITCVVLPIHVVFYRAKNCSYDPQNPWFWHDSDMIVALSDFADKLNNEEEKSNAGTCGT